MLSEVVIVCLHIVLDSIAAAPYEAAWCRSNREIIPNQRSERHRSQHSVLLRVLGRMSGQNRTGGRCRTNGAPSRLAQRVEVDTKEVRIMGSKGVLLRTLVAAESAKTAGSGVPSFVPKWRARHDSNV
jgi:hypothetical protein